MPVCEKYLLVKRAVCDWPCFLVEKKGKLLCSGEPKRKSVRADKCEKVIVMRKENDRIRKAKQTSSEAREQTVQRLEQDRVRKASMRASETHEETVQRLQQNRARMASMRASETREECITECSEFSE